MKRIFVTLALAVTSLLAQAAAPTPQSIEKLLTLTQADKVIDAIKPQVNASMKAGINQALKGHAPSAEEQKVIDDYVAKSVKIMDEVLTMDRLKPIYVQLYTQYFNQKEIDGLIAFYQSPAGKSMLTKMPQLMQGLMAAMPALMAPMVEQMQAASKQMADDLNALQK